jgi:hypothetical protein
VAEISDESDIAVGGVKQKTDGVLRVVRNGESVYEQIGDFKTGAGVKEPAVEMSFEDTLKFIFGGAVAVNRDVQLGGDASESLNVVGVLMGDENGGEVFRRAPNAGEALPNLAWAEPGVHEDAGFGGFDIGAISAGTAAENGEFDGHKWTLVAERSGGKFFRRDGI